MIESQNLSNPVISLDFTDLAVFFTLILPIREAQHYFQPAKKFFLKNTVIVLYHTMTLAQKSTVFHFDWRSFFNHTPIFTRQRFVPLKI